MAGKYELGVGFSYQVNKSIIFFLFCKQLQFLNNF